MPSSDSAWSNCLDTIGKKTNKQYVLLNKTLEETCGTLKIDRFIVMKALWTRVRFLNVTAGALGNVTFLNIYMYAEHLCNSIEVAS